MTNSKTNAVKTVTTDLLNIAYLEHGSVDAPVILLLHGWPDDATTWEKVAPNLANKGFRTIAPWLRGFGGTTFKDAGVSRTGNAGMLALDAIALMDALTIKQFFVAGHDWGSNTAESLAVGYPERVKAMALLSSPPRLGGIKTPTFQHAQLEWYHWFQATKVGAAAVKSDPKGFAKIMWDNWAPPGWYTPEEFETVSQSWSSNDWVDVTIHSYRSRWGEEEPDPLSQKLEQAVKSTKTLSLPTLYIQGEADGVNPPVVSEDVYQKFSGSFERLQLPGVGHFPSREAPAALSTALLEFFTFQKLLIQK